MKLWKQIIVVFSKDDVWRMVAEEIARRYPEHKVPLLTFQKFIIPDGSMRVDWIVAEDEED